MQQDDYKLLLKAKSGNKRARNDLIERNKLFIMKAASKFCMRSLKWENDDELSIAMIAFNEAIDTYDSSRGSSFSNYAYLVIYRRLTDYMRREGKKHRSLVLEEDENYSQGENESAHRFEEIEKILWKEEMEMLVDNFKKFDISVEELVSSSPKQQRVRKKLANLARDMSKDQEVVSHIQNKRQLPVKKIILKYGISRKFVETWRRYLIVLIIIITNPEFVLIENYINSIFEEGRKK